MRQALVSEQFVGRQRLKVSSGTVVWLGVDVIGERHVAMSEARAELIWGVALRVFGGQEG